MCSDRARTENQEFHELRYKIEIISTITINKLRETEHKDINKRKEMNACKLSEIQNVSNEPHETKQIFTKINE